MTRRPYFSRIGFSVTLKQARFLVWVARDQVYIEPGQPYRIGIVGRPIGPQKGLKRHYRFFARHDMIYKVVVDDFGNDIRSIEVKLTKKGKRWFQKHETFILANLQLAKMDYENEES